MHSTLNFINDEKINEFTNTPSESTKIEVIAKPIFNVPSLETLL